MSSALRIGARPSALALAQAAIIGNALTQRLSRLVLEIVPISTSGDKMSTASLARVGGKGLFVRELEQALGERRIDIAVHSMKDLPATLPPEFRLAAVPQRDVSNDVLLARTRGSWASLRQGARLGTSSIRRRFQALHVRPDLEVLPLRGNVDTRLRRLGNGDFDAIILAAAGLKRLGFARNGENGINVIQLDVRNFVTSGGQGALAVESLTDSPVGGSAEIDSAISELTDSSTFAEITAERAFLASIGASCVSPVGVNGSAVDERLTLRAQLFSADGAHSHSAELTDKLPLSNREPLEQGATRLGEKLGHLMLEQGAGEFVGRE